MIDPYLGKVKFGKVFDTYKSSIGLEEFINTIDPLKNMGYIIVAVCKDDCITNLSDHVKKFFEDLGSKELKNLEYRQGWALIGIYGKKAAHEKRAIQKNCEVSVTDIFLLGNGKNTLDDGGGVLNMDDFEMLKKVAKQYVDEYEIDPKNFETNHAGVKSIPSDYKADQFGCKHYKRRCQVKCPECKKFYPCNLCHDDENYVNQTDPKKNHRIMRSKTEEI